MSSSPSTTMPSRSPKQLQVIEIIAFGVLAKLGCCKSNTLILQDGPAETLLLIDQKMGKVSGISFSLAMYGPGLHYSELFLLRCGGQRPTLSQQTQFLDPCPVTFFDYDK